jgi:hypothetical protein
MSAGTMTRDGPPPTFTGLPTELQIKIWHYTLPAPRIIQLHNLNGFFSFHGARPPPALHTCQLSRKVTLSVFEPTFTHNNELPPIYIDLAHDTLHLATIPTMCKRTASLYPDIKEKIQSLAVEISSQGDLEESAVDIALSHLSNLREIIFVVGHEERLVELRCAEHVRFFEPEAPILWRRWKGWMERMDVFKGCVVRIVEAKIV